MISIIFLVLLSISQNLTFTSAAECIAGPLSIPTTTTTLIVNAYSSCATLFSVTIPSTITAIGLSLSLKLTKYYRCIIISNCCLALYY